MTDPGAQGPAGSHGPARLPALLSPMMAVPGALPRDDAGWAFEMKWDGVRALAFIDGGQLRLASRTGRDITVAYPELAPLAAAASGGPLLLDGEVVAFEDGRPSFAQLQPRMHVTSAAAATRLADRIPASYLIFDVLHAAGQPLLEAPYAERRELLESLGLGHGEGSWQVPPSFTGHPGAGILAVSRDHGLEGIVAKRLGSAFSRAGAHRTGARSRTFPGRSSWSAAGGAARAAAPARSAPCSWACTALAAWPTWATSAPASPSRPWPCWPAGSLPCASPPALSRRSCPASTPAARSGSSRCWSSKPPSPLDPRRPPARRLLPGPAGRQRPHPSHPRVLTPHRTAVR